MTLRRLWPHPRSRRTVRATFPVAVVLTVIAACGGGGGEEAATTTTTSAASVAPASTTTTPGGSAATVAPAVSTAPDVAVMPLTGLPVTDEAAATRPALVVKIDNGPGARPQAGLNAADIVFEENVEQITRFAAVYHSQLPDPVGPIRSGRTQDIELLGSLNRPLFAWSGGNSAVTSAVRRSDLRDIGALSEYGPGGYFRSSSRQAPHNLYASGVSLMSLAPDEAEAPPAQFGYRSATDPAVGEPVHSVRLSMDGVRVEWTWDPASAAFQRDQAGEAHLGADGERIDAANVVVLFVSYRPSAADNRSPEAVTMGEGVAWVLVAGRWIEGTWTRGDRLEPIVLTDADGEEIGLTPGRTWVQLTRNGKAAIVADGVDPASVAFP